MKKARVEPTTQPRIPARLAYAGYGVFLLVGAVGLLVALGPVVVAWLAVVLAGVGGIRSYTAFRANQALKEPTPAAGEVDPVERPAA